MYCTLLESFMSLLTVLFVVGLLVLTTECIDFTLLKGHDSPKTLSDLIIPQCYLK